MSQPENGAWCPYCGHVWETCPTKDVFRCPGCNATAIPGKYEKITHTKGTPKKEE